MEAREAYFLVNKTESEIFFICLSGTDYRDFYSDFRQLALLYCHSKTGSKYIVSYHFGRPEIYGHFYFWRYNSGQ